MHPDFRYGLLEPSGCWARTPLLFENRGGPRELTALHRQLMRLSNGESSCLGARMWCMVAAAASPHAAAPKQACEAALPCP